MSYHLPLLYDRHTHPMLYAALADGIDLNQPDVVTRRDALERIRARVRSQSSEWTIATGWSSGRYPLSKQDFDDLPPVVVLNISLHGLIANDAARARIRQHDGLVAEHLHDQDWIERYLRRVLNVFAKAGATTQRLRAFFESLLTDHGVYRVDEMLLVDEDEIRLCDEAGVGDRVRFWSGPDVFEACSPVGRARIHGIKLFTDGAIGVGTAAMHAPYRDSAGRGMLLYTDAELAGLMLKYANLKPFAIHAIGDRAIDQVVAAAEHVARERRSPAGIRMEHAQLISESTARRAKVLGIQLCMQPNFSEDSVMYADRLPDGYPARNNPFRMLIDRVGFVPGEDLWFGSDGMPHGVREALRQSLCPAGGHRDQVLTLDEFAAGYCLATTDAGFTTVDIDDGRVHCDVTVRGLATER
jgi:predicted amidohydrolase YtcJ